MMKPPLTGTDRQSLFLNETLKAMVTEGLVKHHTTAGNWQVAWSTFDEQRAGSLVLTSVRDVIRGWLDRITTPARDLLTAAAVLAEEASFNNLTRVVGLEESEVLTALDELLSRQLLRQGDDSLPTPVRDPAYSFAHQMIGATVYAKAGTDRRRMLHRRAFEALQTRCLTRKCGPGSAKANPGSNHGDGYEVGMYVEFWIGIQFSEKTTKRKGLGQFLDFIQRVKLEYPKDADLRFDLSPVLSF